VPSQEIALPQDRAHARGSPDPELMCSVGPMGDGYIALGLSSGQVPLHHASVAEEEEEEEDQLTVN
jgi:hypothetical protein